MFCGLILYVSGGTYSLTLILDNRFLRNFKVRFIYSQSFWQESAERKSPRLTRDTNLGFAFNKSTHFQLDYVDFKLVLRFVPLIQDEAQLSMAYTCVWQIPTSFFSGIKKLSSWQTNEWLHGNLTLAFIPRTQVEDIREFHSGTKNFCSWLKNDC